MPDERDTLLPAAPAAAGAGSAMNDQDKQMFIKALLDLKQEVDELKRLVHSQGAAPVHPQSSAPVQSQPQPRFVSLPDDEPEEQYVPEEPAVAESGPSLRQANDDLIERALARNGGKVKLAAAELGISERTIYRKLAEKKGK